MMLELTRHVKLANIFLGYVLARNIRYQQDLVEQHCSTSEKRLARILLLLAHYDGDGSPESTVPMISHWQKSATPPYQRTLEPQLH
jgi:hypothetical protein